jgi:hypothetical protein
MRLALGVYLLSQAAWAGPAALEPCKLPKLDEPARCGSLEVFEDHLVVPNGGHSFNNLAGCVDEIIADFVAKGSADGLDTTCADRIALPAFALPPAPLQ